MNTTYFAESRKGNYKSRWPFPQVILPIALLCSAGNALLAQGEGQDRATGFCTRTSDAILRACQHEIEDDYWIALAICNNLSDPAERAKCQEEAQSARQEAEVLCGAQYNARLMFCEEIGEEPYDPEIDPALFVDPADIGTTVPPNPYFPLIRGTTWIYQNGTELITVTVTEETNEILGVTTAVIHDVVEENGELIEDTKDWYGQDIYGNVWYFGEIVLNYEEGELVNIEGSWTAGVDGAKAGIIMKAVPTIEDVYRQEFSAANAEDAAEVLSLTGSADVPAASCNGDCLVTKDFTPIEPGAVTDKYYKPGIGLILEFTPSTGERVELIEIRENGRRVHDADLGMRKTTPAGIQLGPNYPNPFNPSTSIAYSLSADSWVTLKVYNILGEEIITLLDNYQTAGTHSAVWNGRNSIGNTVSSGTYIHTVATGGVTKSRRMIFAK